MNTIQKGDLCVAMIIAAFLKKHYVVLQPVSENSRYDLVIDRGFGFERVQCKHGCLRNGTIKFRPYSSTSHHKNGQGKLQNYRGQIEWFAIYCSDTDQCYLIDVNEIGVGGGFLRVDPPKNNHQNLRMAADYII